MSGILCMMQGSAGRQQVTITLSANTNNYTLNTAKVAGYVAGNVDVTLVINSGVSVGSSSAGSYAFTVDSSWNSLDTVKITNNGNIYGALNSGPALSVARATTVANNGVIGGGGGAGGTGQSAYSPDWGDPPCSCVAPIGPVSGGGGGNGAGWNGSSLSAATGGSAGGYTTSCAGSCNVTGGTGGTGGSYGSAGATGGNASGNCGVCIPAGPYGGGGGGSCTNGNANITWTATGTRYGALN